MNMKIAVDGISVHIDTFLAHTEPAHFSANTNPEMHTGGQIQKYLSAVEQEYIDIYQSVIALNDQKPLPKSLFDDIARILTVPRGELFLAWWATLRSEKPFSKGDVETVVFNPRAVYMAKRKDVVSMPAYQYGVDSVFKQRLFTVRALLNKCLDYDTTLTFTLDKDGTLTRVSTGETCDFGKTGLPFRMLKAFAQKHGNNFRQTRLLSKDFKVSDYEFRKCVYKMRKKLHDRFRIAGKDIIENDRGSGYHLTTGVIITFS